MALKIGWSIKMRCGQRATIINIKNEDDIDVQFDDGGIVEHITYHKLLMRGFKSPVEIFNNPRKITYEKVKKEFENRGCILLENKYINALTKMRYICKKHPDIVQEIKYNGLQQGRGCKKCGYETVSNKLKQQKKTSYDKVQCKFEKANLILLTTESDYMATPNPVMKFTCSCSPDLVQEKTWSAFRQAPYCSLCSTKDKDIDRRRKHYREFVLRCEEKGYTPLSSLEEYKNVVSPLRYICPKHGEQTINLSHLREGKGCPICNESKGEAKIRQWLENNKICYTPQKRFKDLYNKSNKAKLSYDFFLPQFNILIEYQGAYHDGKVHERNPRLQTLSNLEQQKYRDELKRNYAKQHNYQLLEIWYWDYENIESILEKELNINAK